MKEEEIRPEALLTHYIALSAQDAEQYFKKGERLNISCVACEKNNYSHCFIKNNFTYVECDNCRTLYLNPRPPLAMFEKFYRESKSSQYWADVFYPAVADIRREKIIRPRVRRLQELFNGKKIEIKNLIDVGAGYGIFLDEWRSLRPGIEILAVEPSTSLANECRKKGFSVAENIVENLDEYSNSADLVTCFEVLEHVYSPLRFIKALAQLTVPGGYVFISSLCIDGFDLQVLGEKSSQISPPHHINFLSKVGFVELFKLAGLVDLEIITPGELDVDIVRNAARLDPSIIAGQPFLNKLLSDDVVAAAFQNFLVNHGLSSHVWVIGRKPTIGSDHG
jgi:SAM-dependent methyltransferase